MKLKKILAYLTVTIIMFWAGFGIFGGLGFLMGVTLAGCNNSDLISSGFTSFAILAPIGGLAFAVSVYGPNPLVVFLFKYEQYEKEYDTSIQHKRKEEEK